MRPLTKTFLALAALWVAPLFVAGQLRADTYIIGDLGDGNPSNKQIGTSTLLTGGGGGPEQIEFFITSVSGAPVLGGLGSFGLAEPGNLTFASDTTTIQQAGGGLLSTAVVSFASDSEVQTVLCSSLSGGCIATENGLPQTIATINWKDGTSATIQVQSDINESTSPVPEPSSLPSLLLFGTGLVGIVGTVKRKLLS